MIKQSERYFRNSLPINVELIEPQNELVFHNHITAIIVLSGKINIDFFYKSDTYHYGEVIFIDACTPVLISCRIKDSQIIRIDFNTYYYGNKFPLLYCTSFHESLIRKNREILAQLINICSMVSDSEVPNRRSLDVKAEQLLLKVIMEYQEIKIHNFTSELIIYLNENYVNKQLLSDYAKKLCISENYLSHIVRNESGISFRKLLAKIRCQKSLQLLTLQNYRLSDLSFDIGYSSLSYFNKNFKEAYGIFPLEYKSRVDAVIVGNSKIADDPDYLTLKLDEFAHKQNLNISTKSDIIYSRNYINSNDVISSLPDYMSDIGRIKNISADMNEAIHLAFTNMRQGFPMNTIVIEADESFNYSDTSVYITISKNICYLQNLGFIVALEIKNMNQATLHAAINFLGFYGKVYRKNIESIQFILSGDSTSKEEVQKFKKQLSEALLSKNNLQLKIQIDSPAIPLVNYIPELYDSHVLAPFAMDELFHPENWSKEMDFSLIDNVNKNGMMLSGGNGLLTWNGKQKPWWYAYNFVAKLSGNLISKGNDHLISSDGNKMVIITYNLCEEKPSYLSTLNSIEKLHKASEKKGYSREHYFKIFNLSGNYRITHYEINKSTCLFSKWFDMGCPDYLSDEDENSLHFACHPVTNYSVFQADGTIEVSTFEESFGVNCIIIEKV